jgi:arylsulfatase A-like enzyme
MAQRPNIIICLCDQLRAFATGCYGNSAVHTPHIDRLAGGSVRFATAVTNNPVCMAARSALISGQYSRTCNGHLGNDYVDTGGKGWSTLEPEWPEPDRGACLPETTLPEALAAAGYESTAIGKWHIRPAPEAIGFQHSALPLNNHRHTRQQFVVDGAAPVAAEGFSVEREMEMVEAFLADRASRTAPFLLYYNIMPPHMPLGDMPEQYLTMYAPEQISLRANVMRDGQLPVSEEWFKIYLWDYVYYHYREPHALKRPAGFDIRALTALYYGAVTWADAMVGRMLRALENSGLAEDTIVVFTADHGDNLGSHHQWNKGVLLEESIRVPLLFCWPGRWPAAVNRGQVASLIDIMPTLLDACGLAQPAHVQGQSLLPILRGDRDALERNWAFIETSSSSAEKGRTEIGVRTPRYLYGMSLEADSHALANRRLCFYDLQRDPYQLDNMAASDRVLDIETQLQQRLFDWHAQTPWLNGPDVNPNRTRWFDQDGMPRQERAYA